MTREDSIRLRTWVTDDGRYLTVDEITEDHLRAIAGMLRREMTAGYDEASAGIKIGPLQFLRVLNTTDYAPKHYVDIAFVAQWQSGEPTVREPDKVESWSWYDVNDIPSPLFSMLPSAIAMMIDARPLQICQDLP